MKKGARVALGVLALAAVAGAVALRQEALPPELPRPVADVSPAALSRLKARAASSAVDPARLARELEEVDFLLVGEEPFCLETQRYLTSLLSRVGSRKIALLLELPSSLQGAVDTYVASGRSDSFEAARKRGAARPYGEILSWASRNRGKLSRVVAMDRGRTRILLDRALRRDTRERIFAEALLDAHAEGPRDLVVAYGGQSHVLLSGRSPRDDASHVPAGARLLAAGIPRQRIRSVIVSGYGKAPVCDLVPKGSLLATDGELGGEASPCFLGVPVFGAASVRELFDYFMPLGWLTRADGR